MDLVNSLASQLNIPPHPVAVAPIFAIVWRRGHLGLGRGAAASSIIHLRDHRSGDFLVASMEICARNLSTVQQPLAALSSMETNERRRFRPGIFVDKLEDEVFCPKPRRPCNSGRRQKSSTPRSSDAGFEILDIFLSKSSYGEPSNFGCSPPYFSGSPPTRAGNPLVRDVQFGRQRPPPAITPSSTTPSTGGRSQQTAHAREASRGSSPCIRVEGFASTGADIVSAIA
ncbi:uncharacterized protein LOC112348268 [Selaginella moellendorffii]|uniref:uncharacterized protein LOC112348268 n=1 Tax=Selaginella moellendorffii TaxID=88036 RepID=UPI000D1C3684|nr:uncharacterized protein LOC112348268 [Selaginella moellendorffii]|eukprot:XP_024536220.1 uncharacterized protein LOC112348268 [Selaginella moellendorffii]